MYLEKQRIHMAEGTIKIGSGGLAAVSTKGAVARAGDAKSGGGRHHCPDALRHGREGKEVEYGVRGRGKQDGYGEEHMTTDEIEEEHTKQAGGSGKMAMGRGGKQDDQRDRGRTRGAGRSSTSSKFSPPPPVAPCAPPASRHRAAGHRSPLAFAHLSPLLLPPSVSVRRRTRHLLLPSPRHATSSPAAGHHSPSRLRPPLPAPPPPPPCPVHRHPCHLLPPPPPLPGVSSSPTPCRIVPYARERVLASTWKHYFSAEGEYDRHGKIFDNKVERVLGSYGISTDARRDTRTEQRSWLTVYGLSSCLRGGVLPVRLSGKLLWISGVRRARRRRIMLFEAFAMTHKGKATAPDVQYDPKAPPTAYINSSVHTHLTKYTSMGRNIHVPEWDPTVHNLDGEVVMRNQSAGSTAWSQWPERNQDEDLSSAVPAKMALVWSLATLAALCSSAPLVLPPVLLAGFKRPPSRPYDHTNGPIGALRVRAASKAMADPDWASLLASTHGPIGGHRSPEVNPDLRVLGVAPGGPDRPHRRPRPGRRRHRPLLDFRAVCRSWRSATADPKASPCDPRFLPRHWALLDEVHRSDARLFVNVATGRFVRKDLPLLRRYLFVAGGLIVVAEKSAPHAARVLNPFTGSLISFKAPVPPELQVVAHVICSSSPLLVLLACDKPRAIYGVDAEDESFHVQKDELYTHPLVWMALAGVIYAASRERSFGSLLVPCDQQHPGSSVQSAV
ncbi:hypothetical protein PR202_ga15304 [Eleusine coracana subsp. coracana]|uniref:Uncharacterized protein n=1 Tax=Eleusine coracana subsp. coracana TaxID=191504 RepID=A0AAV5CJT9_ELECO|nr:hypothetical protein PR202_ga15304 [Eleusine coracana subsp. coracana]